MRDLKKNINHRTETNRLLIQELNMEDEFQLQKSNEEGLVTEYATLLQNLVNNQVGASLRWMKSKEGREKLKARARYQREVFKKLESEWDAILQGNYQNIDELLNRIYDEGKKHGYDRMREIIRYTDADKRAFEIARKYNYQLITRLDNDTRSAIKNKIIEGVISGKNPREYAKNIRETGLQPLPGSTLSPHQRAVMIARTENSRIRNTGMLQSFVDEGYTEVKILTAEDGKVCPLCLATAFEYNQNDEITLENHGERSVHKISDLNEWNTLPLHPNCRCTYLTVWESKTKALDEPNTVVDLTKYSRNWNWDLLTMNLDFLNDENVIDYNDFLLF